MITSLATLLAVEPWMIWLIAGVALFAGIVRGFAGFALSAIVMASLASFIPPFELLAVTFLLELTASLMLVRGSFKQADRSLVMGLMVFNWIGWPIGLALTVWVSTQSSQLMALCLITFASLLLLANFKPKNLDNVWGRSAAGLAAGVASGIASIGGLMTALYALTLDRPATQVRASLILFLLISTSTSWFFLWWYGAWSTLVFHRALFCIPFVVLGVLIGTRFFNPRFQPYYRQFCLVLLIGLSLAGLGRLLLSGS